ncbi:MAG: alpha/beta fold hydrolase [Betaproteobacteria bacterium]|nr:alpha/beta fold hydrolase [Betaproteobacteria bacterium]
MFANLVRLALLAELAAWTALGAWLARSHGWSVAGAVVLAVAGSAGIRLALVCTTLGLSWLARSPREPGERLGPAGIVRLVAGEWRAMLANNFAWIPFERLVVRADPPLAPAARVPVILVHGYFSNRGTVSGLANALDAAGIAPVFVPSLPAILAPIEAFAEHLARIVDEVTQATGQPRAILVCHSMGGLVARTYLRSRGAGRVAGLVTLGSPHHGTALAKLGAGHNGRQMRAGSEFLRDLERAEGEGGPGCEALSVFTVHDNLVAPQESSRLGWARSVRLHGVAHLAMLLDPRVHRAVLEEVGRLGAGPAG